MNDAAAVVEGITDKLIVEKSSGVGHMRKHDGPPTKPNRSNALHNLAHILDGFNGECNLCRRPATPTRIECEWAGWMLFADHVSVDFIVRES